MINPSHRAVAAVIAACTLAGASATALTPDQALERALSSTEVTARHRLASQRYALRFTQPSLSDPSEASVYIFGRENNKDNGFLVVNASDDENMPALLGYSESGALSNSAGQMAPGLEYMLEQYARQIQYAKANPSQGKLKLTGARTAKNPIEPLTVTHWNQDAPYNDLCPEDNGTRCPTGCVATALSQVMYYHQWPEKGTGSHSYTWNNETLSQNYSDITFQWGEMLHNYDSTSSATADQAVATLMYAAGVSVNMDYTATESGSQALSVPASMVNYFGYDKGIRYMARDYYGLYDWENIVYDQLVNYGPVQYSGQSEDGGHSFVCDGYSDNGYFHINWGWGGMSDGYFLLTALDPEEQGIGGSTSGYNYDQSIIANVSHPVAGSEMYPNLMYNASFSIEESTATPGSSINADGVFYNFSTGPVTGTLGLCFTSMTDSSVQYAEGSALNALPFARGMASYSVVLPTTLSDGTYKVTPVFKNQDGKWYDILVPISGAQSSTMKLQDGTATFTTPQTASISVTDIQMGSEIYLGSKFEITGTITNTSGEEYYGAIAAAIVQNGSIVALGGNYPVDLLAGQDTDMVYISELNSSSLAAGTYQLYMIDTSTYTSVGDPLTVTVNAAPATTTVAVSGLTMADGNTTSVDKENIHFTANVDCTAGYFGGTLTVAIFNRTGGSSIGMVSSSPLFISEGKSDTLDAVGSFPDGVAGTEYMACVFNGQTQVSNPMYFTLSAVRSGVEDITTDCNGRTTIYDLGGNVVSGDYNLRRHGVYIIRTVKSDGTVNVSKILR